MCRHTVCQHISRRLHLHLTPALQSAFHFPFLPGKLLRLPEITGDLLLLFLKIEKRKISLPCNFIPAAPNGGILAFLQLFSHIPIGHQFQSPWGPFPLVVSNPAMHYIENLETVFQKVHRTLKPEPPGIGPLIITLSRGSESHTFWDVMW